MSKTQFLEVRIKSNIQASVIVSARTYFVEFTCKVLFCFNHREHPCLEFSQFCEEVKETSFEGGWVVVASNDALKM